MDPNPTSFPFLSYVLSRLPLPTSPRSSDLQQPPVPTRPPGATIPDQIELVVDRMPHLDHRPSLLASMTSAISDVAETRSILRSLGERPDHESIDTARARLSEIDADLSASRGLDQPELRDALADEKTALQAMIQLDEMHEAYEKLLHQAEERLEKMYRDGGEGSAEDEPLRPQQKEEVQENEEVIRILQEGLEKPVERVDLSGRQLMILPEAFGKLQGMRSLNLFYNLLEVIPDSISGLIHLEEIRLSSNNLVSLPDSIGLLSNLKILDVSRNKVKVLPESISKCRSLVELDASYNELAYLPTDIGHELLNLERLCIHLNKIRSLPSSICEMRSLRHFDAHFNQLRGLPPAFGKLMNLEYLNLSSNFSDMQELPDSFCDLFNLKELDLSNNQIHVLPDQFGRLEKLAKLHLEQNPLKIPPLEIVNQGVEAVKAYMTKRHNDILLEEERKEMAMTADSSPTVAGWLTRSTSWLNSWVSGVFEGFSESSGSPKASKSPKDPVLDEQY